MYWRTNPIKHNVTTVLGSADWWTFKQPHSCRFCALYHHIHQLLKRAQTSLPFTGLSWFIMLTLHVKGHNSSPHESCLMTSCNPVSISVTTSLQLTCCELHLQKQPGCDLYSALPHDIKPRNETNIHPWKEQTTDGGERPSDNLNLQLQYEKESFKCSADGPQGERVGWGGVVGGIRGSRPSPHIPTWLLDDGWVCVGLFSGQNHLGTGSSSKAETRGKKGHGQRIK